MQENPSSGMGGSQSAGQTVNVAGLPRNYGDTKVVIMPRDPIWFFAYWEVSSGTFENLKNRLGEQKLRDSRWVLRIYDVTDLNFNGKNAHKYFDIGIDYGTENWYVHVNEPNRAWCVDIGLVTPDGEFIMVARSNVIVMPRQGVSSVTDEHWAVLQNEFDRLLKLSGADQLGKTSADIVRLMRERWQEMVSLPTSFGGASSWTRPYGEESKQKGFWLKADTELIVYGMTEPDADLKVQGKKVQLKSDGSFTLRFYLPDGAKDYPIEATSSDGTMEEKIVFNVKRSTE